MPGPLGKNSSMTPSSTHNDENDCIVVSDITNPSGYRDFVDKDVKPKIKRKVGRPLGSGKKASVVNISDDDTPAPKRVKRGNNETPGPSRPAKQPTPDDVVEKLNTQVERLRAEKERLQLQELTYLKEIETLRREYSQLKKAKHAVEQHSRDNSTEAVQEAVREAVDEAVDEAVQKAVEKATRAFEDELTPLRQEAKNAVEEAKKSENMVVILKGEKKDLKQRVDEAEEKRRRLEDELIEANDKIAKLTNDHENQAKAAKSGMGELHQMTSDLEIQVQSRDDEINRLKETVSGLQKQIATKQKEGETEAAKEIANLTKITVSQKAEINSLNQVVMKRNEKIGALEEQNVTLEKEKADLQKRMAELSEEVKGIDKYIMELAEKNKQVEELLEEMRRAEQRREAEKARDSQRRLADIRKTREKLHVILGIDLGAVTDVATQQ